MTSDAGVQAPGTDTVPGVGARPAFRVVAEPRPRAASDEPVRRRTVVVQLALATVVVVLLVAVGGAFASRRLAEREAVTDAAQTTDVLADAVVQPAVTDALARGDAAAVAELQRVVTQHVLTDRVVRVKLWSPQGRIVYSDEPRLVGRTFDLGDDEREVLADPTTRAEVSDLDEPENVYERGRGKLLEVYRPVWTPSGQPLLFETYWPYSTVTARASDLWRGFSGVIASSLLVLVVLLVPLVWRLLDRLQRAQAQRVLLLQRAVEASDDERRRIAGALHDGVVQELAAASFTVAGSAEQAGSLGQPALATRLHVAAGAVRSSIRGLRSLLVDIYPPSLGRAGLAQALRDLTESPTGRDLDVHLEVDVAAEQALDDEGQRLVFRVAQECLRNAARHARATRVDVVVRAEPGRVLLEVDDDGAGFDADAVLHAPEHGHFGTRVLADHVSAAGATLLLSTAPGAGCRWRMEVPA
ncbi:sensor histidine kinase [Angustibacter aerolatus]